MRVTFDMPHRIASDSRSCQKVLAVNPKTYVDCRRASVTAGPRWPLADIWRWILPGGFPNRPASAAARARQLGTARPLDRYGGVAINTDRHRAADVVDTAAALGGVAGQDAVAGYYRAAGAQELIVAGDTSRRHHKRVTDGFLLKADDLRET